jgi:hypothetical protein
MGIFAATLFLWLFERVSPEPGAGNQKPETKKVAFPSKTQPALHSAASISFTPYKQRVRGSALSPQFGPYSYGTNFHLPESADMITMHAS